MKEAYKIIIFMIEIPFTILFLFNITFIIYFRWNFYLILVFILFFHLIISSAFWSYSFNILEMLL
jgi:hypothetical protein